MGSGNQVERPKLQDHRLCGVLNSYSPGNCYGLIKIEMAKFLFCGENHVYIGLSIASRIRERIPGIEGVIQSMIESGEIFQVFKSYYTNRNQPVSAF